MNLDWTQWLATHGYLAISAVVFLAAIGLPMPVSLALLLGGAAAHSLTGGHAVLRLEVLLPLAVLSTVCGNLLLFLGGKYTGWWLLARLCRLSLDPEACIFRSADFFYEKGSRAIIASRFVPGLGALAAPMAGSLNMRIWRFVPLDLLGATIYCSVWITAGYLLSNILTRVQEAMRSAGHLLSEAVLFAVLFYCAYWIWVALKNRKYSGVKRVTATELSARMAVQDPSRPIVIADVRSHGYYDPGMMRIKDSIRVEPSRLPVELEALRETLAAECEIFVYCSCLRDATSKRIAHLLERQGEKVWVIEGGLKEWVRAGFDVEPVPEEDMRPPAALQLIPKAKGMSSAQHPSLLVIPQRSGGICF